MRLRDRLRAARSDDGYTLTELVLTVAIMGVVVAGLVGVVIVYLKTTVDTEARLTESHDVQFAAAYWQRDVASIGVRSYDSGTKTFPLTQSVDITPACSLPGGTRVVTLAWSEYDIAVLDSTVTPPTVTVSYVAQPDDGGYDLMRVRCTGSTVDSTVEVAHSLNVLPTRSCINVVCTGAGDDVPNVVVLHLSVLDPEGNNDSAYTSALVGERRQS